MSKISNCLLMLEYLENGRKYNNSTGMGLYLCKKLCLKLGLGISIKSKLGVGTEVTIVFPINNYNLAED